MKLNQRVSVLCALSLLCLSQQILAFELRGWGGDYVNQVTDIPPGSNFVAMAAGDEHGVALTSDGVVMAWGQDAYGQNLVPPTLGTCIAVGAGGDLSLAIEEAGTIVAWGDEYGVPAGTYTSVDAGESFSVALATDGSIVAWGSDTYGQVTNVPGGTDFLEVVAGNRHAVALRSNGSVVSWGNYNGTVGQPTTGVFTQVSAGYDYCLALADDGSIVFWGTDTWDYGVDEIPAGTDFVEISAGYQHGLARRTDGSVVGWGAGTTAVGHPHWGQAMPPAADDYQAISGGLYWSLSLAGTDDLLFNDGFESGDTSGWPYAQP